MNFLEQPPSKQWAALKYRGVQFAEVWFKPEEEPFTLIFRIPQRSFHIPGMDQRLTIENLLKAVGIATAEVASWRRGSPSPADTNSSDADLKNPLSPPLPDETSLDLYINLQPPPKAVAPPSLFQNGDTTPKVQESRPRFGTDSQQESAPEVPETKWQDLEALWKVIQELEASLDTLRISMEGLRAEMEAASRKTLTMDEKVHALNADVAQWNKAKSRVVYALPKMREFIHRATWAAGAPERKQLEELVKNHIRPRVPFPEMDKVEDQLDNLIKDRQMLSAQGVSVHQECKSISADVQGTLRTLLSNAAANATKKRATLGKKGKYF